MTEKQIWTYKLAIAYEPTIRCLVQFFLVYISITILGFPLPF